MPFGGTDFAPSRTPEASNALQVSARTIVNAAARKTKNLREFTTAIKTQFEAANGIGWHILVGFDYSVDLRYRVGACVLLSSPTSKLKVIIYRTQPVRDTPIAPLYDLSEEEVTTVRNRKGPKVVWYGTDMDDTMKAQVQGYAQALLPKLKADATTTLGVDARLAQALKVQLSYLHGNTWHVIVATSRDLCSLPYCDPATFADFAIDNTRIVVYRHNGAAIDTKVDMTLFLYRAMLTISAICFVVYMYFNYNTTDRHTLCHVTLDEETRLPEGCSVQDVAAVRTHHRFKSAAFIGLFVFTVIASGVRFYRRALRVQLKHG